MNKKTIYLISGCFSSSILFVLVLQLLAVGPNQKKNHFIRVFPPHFFNAPKVCDLNKRKLYIAGITKRFIYLGSYSENNVLYSLSWSDAVLIDYPLHYHYLESTIPSSYHLSVDSPNFFLNNFETGSINEGHLSNPRDSLHKINSPLVQCSILIPVSTSSFAVRAFDFSRKENVLGKMERNSSKFVKWPGLLEPQSEGVFSTDGILRFDAPTDRFVYVYFYRNQFICMDSNFNLIYRANTLDTNLHAKIKTVSIPYRNVTTIASPGFRVNRAQCISSQWIFINSDLRADNEDEKTFSDNLVVDVYDLKSGNYHFSFYLPKLTGKITDMAISQNNLAVIQESRLIIYPLNMDQIKNR